MSAGAFDPSGPNRGANSRNVFFSKVMSAFKRAQNRCDRESFIYAPVGHILNELAAASISPDKNFFVFSDIQPSFKGADDSECSPDFSSVLIPIWDPAESHDGVPPKDSIIFVWEVKSLRNADWFGTVAEQKDATTAQARKALKSHLRQISEQALFAFHQSEGDTVPVILSQGNCFTFLLFDRPSNWDEIEVKYAETLKSGRKQSTATKDAKPATSHEQETVFGPQEQEAALAPQEADASPAAQEQDDARDSSGPQEPETSPGQQEASNVQGSANGAVASAALHNAEIPRGDAAPEANDRQPKDAREEENTEKDKNAESNDPETPDSTPTESEQPVFEKGDRPIPRLIFSCEFILLPDGSGFTPQFLKALHTAMAFRGVTFNPSDRIFSLPDGQQLDDVSTTQSLETAQKAIDDFKAEQEARKRPDQSSSAATSASAASSNLNYTNPRSAIIPPPDGKLWGLRGGKQIMYTSPLPKLARRKPATGRQPVEKPKPKRDRKPSKKTTLDESQDAPVGDTRVNAIADLLNTHDNAVAGPSNARVALLRPPPKSGTQDTGLSKKRKLDQVQDGLLAPAPIDEGAGPSKRRGAAARGRPVQIASQDAGPSKQRKLQSSEVAPAADAHVDEAAAGPAAAGPSGEQVTRHPAEASVGNTKKPGQGSRKGKERAQ